MSDQNPYGQDPHEAGSAGQDPYQSPYGQPQPNQAQPQPQADQPQYGQPSYGQPNYGQPQGGGYGQQQGAYGQQTPFGAGTYGAQVPSWQQQVGIGAPQNPSSYASWGQRFGAYLIDWLLGALTGIVVIVGFVMVIADLREDPLVPAGEWPFYWADGSAPVAGFMVMLLGMIIPIVFWFYNWPYRQGSTGSTIGKKMMGIRVVGEQTHQPIGFGLTWLREIVHYFDGLLFCLGYLWPLWDTKRQTFADKIMSTVVVPIAPQTPVDLSYSYQQP